MFSIKEVSTNLNITPQAIYKQKKALQQKGYMTKNDLGQWEINQEGFNYLKDRQINYMQNKQQVFKPVEQPIEENTEEQEQENFNISSNDSILNQLLNQFKEQITTLQNQLKEEQEQKEYFKAKFEEKDRLLNEYLNHHLLTTGDNQEEVINQEQPKKTFFQRLFNK
jgi:hypothetical protein